MKTTVVKCIRQHSFEIDNIDELKHIAEQYTAVKNYVYSRFSGINSMGMLLIYKKQIRDIWVHSKFAEQWKLPARYWKQALDEAVSNIKTEWSNTKKRVKTAVLKNDNLTDDEKRFILYILKADCILQNILLLKGFKRPEKIEELDIREKYIYNLIRHYIRRFKGSIPYSHKSASFMIDSDMYGYESRKGQLFILIQGIQKGKRIAAALKDNNLHKGNLRIIIKDGTIEIHKAKEVKVRQNWTEEKVIGIDKGYRCLIATSENKFYGENLNELLSKETERLNEVNDKRNKLWALMKKYEEKDNIKKANNILVHNFGRKKYNRNKYRFDCLVKGYINKELNRFIDTDKPSEIVFEDLSFVSWKDRYPKHVKRKLSRWIKGYIQERINYKAALKNIALTKINPAYTSQFCHKCGTFGKRSGEIFECQSCGRIQADFNASCNIKSRKDISEISLYTPYKQVKEIMMRKAKSA